jgi:hypothetical protein
VLAGYTANQANCVAVALNGSCTITKYADSLAGREHPDNVAVDVCVARNDARGDGLDAFRVEGDGARRCDFVDYAFAGPRLERRVRRGWVTTICSSETCEKRP